MIESIRTPGTRVKVTSKSILHEGVIGRVVRDYINTILLQVEDEKHRHAYKSRVGVNSEGLDPKSFLPGKFIMVFPHTIVEIAKKQKDENE